MMSMLHITCRPALASDTSEMLELTKNIWEGHDYVPLVWEDWLADPHGRLAVAESDGRVLGLGKLTRLSPDDWWLEGLRVHPEFEGQGIASKLHDYLVHTWDEIGTGTIRLVTASFRLAVHHLCERLDFQKLGEYTPYVAPVETNTVVNALESKFKPVLLGEISQAVEHALQSASLEFSFGLMDLGWQMAPPREIFLEQAIKNNRLWWWRAKRGLLAFFEDDDEERGKTPMIGLVACPDEYVTEILLDFRCLAGSLGYQHAAWNAPLHDGLLSHLEAAGFVRDWDKSIYIFAKNHPKPIILT